jgi:hypothetical protein
MWPEPWRYGVPYTAGRGASDGALVSKKAEEFRRKAALCERMARQVHDPEARRELEDLARGYLHLAEYHDRTRQMLRFVSRKTDDD